MTWTPTELTAIITAGIGAIATVFVAFVSRKNEQTKKEEAIECPAAVERAQAEPSKAVMRSERDSAPKKSAAQISDITHKR